MVSQQAFLLVLGDKAILTSTWTAKTSSGSGGQVLELPVHWSGRKRVNSGHGEARERGGAESVRGP